LPPITDKTTQISLNKTQILIIGAGPAGATASLFLAKAGIAHTIVDAATFPRDKVCGDGLDLKVARVLNALNPDLMRKAVAENPDFMPIHGIRFFSPSGRESLYHYTAKADEPNFPLFYTSKRFHFDNFLVSQFDQKYTDWRPACSVQSIKRVGEGWSVQLRQNGQETELYTDFIVAADGDHSIMLRTLGKREIDKTHYAATLRQYYSGIEGMHTTNAIEVYMPPKLPMSYFYIFPLPNNEANVGYGMTSEVVAKHKYNLREIFQDLIKTDPVLKERFQNAKPLEKPIGWGLPLASLKRKTFGDGYVLIGDAASLVGPTNGEGIGTGMMSGLIAAHFIKAGLAKKDLSEHHFRNFDREVYRRLQTEMSTYRLIMRLKPWFLWDTMLNIGLHLPFMKRKFEGQVGGWLRTAYEKEIDINVD
jgi:menaquinone-9 beta-reductase